VLNKNFGPVLFTGEKIDEESGLQLGSTIDIYSSVLEQGVFNLIHMHINDTNTSVSIDVVTLDENENIKPHLVFGKDAMGNPLRYKVLIRNDRVHSVFYNTGSKAEVIPFKEIQYSANEIGINSM
jgi:hypothetical protein